MSARRRLQVHEWIAIDLNTQQDFCEPGGRHPMANLSQVLPALRRMMAWVKWHGIPLVSSMDSHRTTEMSRSGHPICCFDGSNGQRKVRFTMVRRHLRVEFDNTFAVPIDPFKTHQQLLFRQRTDDLLSNPKAERFLNQALTREFLLFGNSLELAVKALALGLLAQDKKVAIVTDACGVWNRDEADLAIRQMETKGARITTVAEVTAQRPPLRMAYHRLPLAEAASHGHPNGNGHALPTQPHLLNGNGIHKTNGRIDARANAQTNAPMNGHTNGNGQLPH